jgi:hypothetical protein
MPSKSPCITPRNTILSCGTCLIIRENPGSVVRSVERKECKSLQWECFAIVPWGKISIAVYNITKKAVRAICTEAESDSTDACFLVHTMARR